MEAASYDGDAIQTASGWDIINNEDQFIGFVLDGKLVELELSGLKFHKFPFRADLDDSTRERLTQSTVMKDKRLFPEYRGFEFWLVELFAGYGHEDSPNYGYVLRSVGERSASSLSGGAYATKHEATKAAFARIETLTFDR